MRSHGYVYGYPWLGSVSMTTRRSCPAKSGRTAIRALLPQAAERLRPGGLVLLEIGWRQGEAAAALARAAFPAARIAVRPDFAGHDRLVVIETEPSQG